MTDLKEMPYADLMELRNAVLLEVDRRRTLANASAQADELSHKVAHAEGLKQGDPWRALPSVGYPIGWEVTHAGKKWISTTPFNVWRPGESGWREYNSDGTPPPYKAPTGAHDAYKAGELITWTDGKVYRAVRNGVAHSPAEAPADWEVVTVVTSTPPPVTVTYEPWAPGKAYTVGWYVSYGGKNYQVLQAHPSRVGWEPPVVPALYLQI